MLTSIHIAVRRDLLERLLLLAPGKYDGMRLSMLFLVAYIFLLRVPSEALPLTAHEGSSCLFLEGGQVVLLLKRRKNKPSGSRLTRACWCCRSPSTCPVHVLWPFVASLTSGQGLFSGITPQHALTSLRQWLLELRAPRALEFRTHDFGRGHAKDLQPPAWYTCQMIKVFLYFCQGLHYGTSCPLANGVRRYL